MLHLGLVIAKPNSVILQSQVFFPNWEWFRSYVGPFTDYVTELRRVGGLQVLLSQTPVWLIITKMMMKALGDIHE